MESMAFKHICLITLAACMPGLASASGSAASSIPAWFEQLPGGAFAARATEGHLILAGARAKLAFRTGHARNPIAGLEWALLGANASAEAEGGARRSSHTNYFIGSGSKDWRQDSAHYGEVRVPGAYPGIDVVWYASGRLLEYDFVVAPGADPKAIHFKLSGASPKLTPEGDLVYGLGQVKVRQGRPAAYQIVAGARRVVEAGYKLMRDGSVKIKVGKYDRSETLVIDPVLSYSGYLGGTGLDIASGIVLDSAGAVWVAGTSTSDVDSDWTLEPFKTFRSSAKDAFLARMIPDAQRGWKLDYWAYLGGSSDDECIGLAIAPGNIMYLAGRTYSSDFPLAGLSHQTENKGQGDVFLLRYNPTWEGAATLEYSSYVGTTAAEIPLAVAANANGWATVAGYTLGGELPTGAMGSALQPSNRGGADGFVYTFNTRGAKDETLPMATFFGGNGTDLINAAAMDETGNVYITGVTMSWDLPLEGASYQAEYRDNGDAFLAILDPRQSGFDTLKYATFLGGFGLDVALGMHRTASGIVWLTGYTTSDGMPVTPGAHQLSRMGPADAWVAAVDPSKSGAEFITYMSYVGGQGTDIAYAVSADGGGNPTLAGYTDSPDYPVKNPPVAQSEQARGFNAFITSLKPAEPGLGALSYSALFGGRGSDTAIAIFQAADGTTAVAGHSTSADLTVSGGTGKQNGAGLRTSFFIKLNPDPKP
ncbi:MAG: hypothetical protein C0504_04430 [Candidatus Solibacter sp.]|nr:hypothetical protein [Candidatus Solibacter sp.]